MSYVVQGYYCVENPIDFRDTRPLKKVETRTFLMRFDDWVPLEIAKEEVNKRARWLSSHKIAKIKKGKKYGNYRNIKSKLSS